MPILRKLKGVLDQAKTSYEAYNHPKAITAQEIAATQYLSGKEMAKVVIMKIDGSFAMAVLPANRLVNFEKIKGELRAREASLADEDEFSSLFPECEIGAMPPFGNLFGLPVYADPSLEKHEHIFFNAGTHLQTVRMSYRDFNKLVRPEVFDLTYEAKKKAA